jgi:hypothetical protein
MFAGRLAMLKRSLLIAEITFGHGATPRPRISLDLLRGFYAAARHLNFTRAAHELCVTQPAISCEIKVLEEQLGQPLFRRVNRALQLTHVEMQGEADLHSMAAR